MRTPITRTALLRVARLGAVCAALASGGCTAALVAGAAAAGIAGTYVYFEGRLESDEQAPLDAVYEATVQAMRDMEFPIKEQSKDALEAHVTAVRADDTEINIAMEKKTEETTSLRIRVGVVGDEEVSSEILSHIRENLKKP